MYLLLISLLFNMAHAAEPARMNDFITKLMSKMTLEEKVGQMTQYAAEMSVTGSSIKDNYREEIIKGRAGSILNGYTPQFTRQLQDIAVKQSRLKIPLLFALDVVHGHRTIFPIPLGESCSWDMKLMERTARVAATEASADGVQWTFAPMIDISRDPRWGRIAEGSGEDPFLGSKIAVAKVHGYQTDNLGNIDTIMACAKHYVAYGAATAGRDYSSVDMSTRELFENYLPPFEAAVKAGLATLMPAFNDIAGVPSTANEFTLRKILREKWKFDGIVVSDYTAINELVAHGVAVDEKEAVLLAIRAGVDVDMQGGIYMKYLPTLVREGKVPEAAIDKAARRVLEMKYRFGLFKDPYRFSDEKRAQRILLSDENRDVAREAARRAIVLLRNESSILPLKKNANIALIGPLADVHNQALGTWSAGGDAKQTVTLRQGLMNVSNGKIKIQYALGSNLINPGKIQDVLNKDQAQLTTDPRSSEEMLNEALAVAKKADVIVLALGESYNMSGEAASRTHIRLPENQLNLLRQLREKAGKPIILLLSNGRPLALETESKLADAIVETWYLGTESGNAIADVLFGEHNPTGHLTASFPVNEGQIPIFYAARNSGRPFDAEGKYTTKYLDAPNEPLYPFGFGLSYTQFYFSGLKLSSNKMRPNDKIKVTVSVKNTGQVAGEEVVQLYIRAMVSSISRPVKQLRGFSKVYLKAGEMKDVSFTLRLEDLKYHYDEMKWMAEPGAFKVMVGGNSRDVIETGFNLVAK